MAGAVVGVIIGCALGATTLLWVDLDARDRIQRAGQLRDIVHDMIALPPQPQQQRETEQLVGGFRTPCATCTVYIADASNDAVTLTDGNRNSNNENNSNSNNNNNSPTTRLKRMKDADSPSVRQCAETGRFILSSDRHVLYVPVPKRKSIPAAAAAANNSSSSSTGETMVVVALEAATNHAGFVQEDVVAAQIMARHIAIFMDRLSE